MEFWGDIFALIFVAKKIIAFSWDMLHVGGVLTANATICSFGQTGVNIDISLDFARFRINCSEWGACI